MPAWIVWILSIIAKPLLALGKPALIVALKALEGKFPGFTVFIEAVIAWLNQQPDKEVAMRQLADHCNSMICAPQK